MPVIVDDSAAYLEMLGPVLLRAPKDQAITHWLRNIRANPVVRLRVSAGTFNGTARELSEPAELAAARRAYTRTVNPFDSWEYRFQTGDRPTPEKISACTNIGLTRGYLSLEHSRLMSALTHQIRSLVATPPERA